MEACFEGFCLSADVHGEDMDGVLARVVLEDFAVYGVSLRIEGGFTLTCILLSILLRSHFAWELGWNRV